MSHLNNTNGYNPRDYYLLIFKDTGKVYETFRNISTVTNFLKKHPFKDELEIKVNPKYVTTKIK